MHIPASVYRVRGPQRGRLLHGTGGAVGLLSSWDVPHPCSAGEPTVGPAAAGLPCMQGGGVPCARPPLRATGLGSAPCPAPQLSSLFPPFFPLQMRKGPSVSSMPFPPSSPLLSCPPDGARHMVMYRGESERGGGTLSLIPVWIWGRAGCNAAALPHRANWTGTAAAPTATMIIHRQARSCWGE